MANYIDTKNFKEKLIASFVILCNCGSFEKSQIFFSLFNFPLTDSMNVPIFCLFCMTEIVSCVLEMLILLGFLRTAGQN